MLVSVPEQVKSAGMRNKKKTQQSLRSAYNNLCPNICHVTYWFFFIQSSITVTMAAGVRTSAAKCHDVFFPSLQTDVVFTACQ